jgi:4-hydroxyacetophenone monooxygenase
MEAIVESDLEIERALKDAHLPTLMAALVHITGDLSLVREVGTLVFGFLGDYQGKIAPELQARVRAAALEALSRYRDAGCPPPAAPPDEIIRELMSFVGGQPVPDHYVPFLLEELALESGATQARRSRSGLEFSGQSGFRVLVIGAGMSGIAAAVRLSQAGVPFTIVEKNGDVGGTWLENTYPGCRVDSPNHLYSYSFEANHDWPQHYSTQDVLLAYFRRVADKHRLRAHTRFRTEVVEARWDDAEHVWRLRVRGADGREDTLVANAVVSAVGQLNRPRYPNIPGRERFRGASFHSARWDHAVDLRGKRVAVIGTGASAFQFVPEIAPHVSMLAVFQRSAPWLLPTPNYHAVVPEGMKWLLGHVPTYEKWYRFWLFWLATEGLLPYVEADSNWRGPAHTLSENNALLHQGLSHFMRAQLRDDPALLSAALPDYPPGGKRMLRDNGTWFATLKRPHVQLITDPIAEISETGVITRDGREHPVDVLIYGTGFAASDFLQPMTIAGRQGVDLRDHWGGDARAYLGMTIPSFPNLFLMYGPNTNIVVNGSIVFFSECQTRYILGCIDLLLRRGHHALEVRSEPHDAYNARVDAANARMAWGVSNVSSWYKNQKGRVSQNWPFPLVEYWRATLAPNADDFRSW